MRVFLSPHHGFFQFLLLLPEARFLLFTHLLLDHHEGLVLLLLLGIFAGVRIHFLLSPAKLFPSLPSLLDRLDLGLFVVLSLGVDSFDGADLEQRPLMIRVLGVFVGIIVRIGIIVGVSLQFPLSAVFRVQLDFFLGLPGFDALEVFLSKDVAAGADFPRLLHPLPDGVDVEFRVLRAYSKEFATKC